ncbi:MAG TPA: FkbM family methyltransferase, partial [Chryseosolibacter sp.]
DVGANIGFLTLQFANRCKKGIVYAFEPDSETFYKLTQNVNLNKFGNIQLFHTAIGSKSGTGELYRMYESNPGANRILSQKPAVSVRSETVRITTLDEYDSKGCFKTVDLIKIDVEGFELFVLEGARNLILQRRPILFIELVDQNLKLQSCSGQSVIDYLAELNYLIFDAKTMKPLEESDNYYTDILCYPSKSS